ncbi:MAG: DNA replication and repair protein RecF [Actinomycetota bacterium]|nr:DNA replication and repair protein RecF [Actinomycetota bacterium]
MDLGAGLTVAWGRNGVGKTNLLEALYFACTGRSCRTSNEREVVRFGGGFTRLELGTSDADATEHHITVGFEPGQPKRLQVDGAAVERLSDSAARPLVCVFLPDRLELVSGPPALRRGHLDQVIAAVWPSRRATRTAYSAALAQRNALLARIRAGRAGCSSLPAWDSELSRHGFALMSDRIELVESLGVGFAEQAEALGLDGQPSIRYRPRSRAKDAEELAGELAGHVDQDLERGFTTHGPHRDDLVFRRSEHDLRAYGSRGQQRVALLALLLAERAHIGAVRGSHPLMLLDDVMSELDGPRRAALTDQLLSEGQSLITTTDLSHVPGSDRADVVRLAVGEGTVEHSTAEPGERVAS